MEKLYAMSYDILYILYIILEVPASQTEGKYGESVRNLIAKSPWNDHVHLVVCCHIIIPAELLRDTRSL